MNLFKTLLLTSIYFISLSFINITDYICGATWYNTKGHPKVHRNHSTTAASRYLINKLNLKVGKIQNGSIVEGSYLIVTNISNNKTDTVEVTDVCKGTDKLDLSLQSFEKISKKSAGRIKVKVVKLK